MWNGSLYWETRKNGSKFWRDRAFSYKLQRPYGGKNEGDLYGAKTILNFGFGEKQEVGTQGIADTVRSKIQPGQLPYLCGLP